MSGLRGVTQTLGRRLFPLEQTENCLQIWSMHRVGTVAFPQQIPLQRVGEVPRDRPT